MEDCDPLGGFIEIVSPTRTPFRALNNIIAIPAASMPGPAQQHHRRRRHITTDPDDRRSLPVDAIY
jgi:hypothetical protein